MRRLRNTLIVLAGLAVAFVAFGYFAVPPIAKAKLVSLLHDELGRDATIGKIAFDPFTLRATMTDFKLADRTPGPPLLEFDELDVDVSSTSMWRWAPVLDALKITRPRVALTRNADGTYNIQDIIERILAAPPGPPPRFSVNNIVLEDGAIRLDDKPNGRVHEVSGVGIGVPFLSSLPYAAQIRVLPRLAAVVNGSAFALGGSTSSPFEDVKEAALDVDLDALPLPKYIEYAPLPLAAKLAEGALTTRLKVTFVTEKGVPTTLKVTGTARIDRFALKRVDGTPLVSASRIDATIGAADLLARTIALDHVAIDTPNVDVVRLRDGALELARLAAPAKSAPPASAGPAHAATPAPAPWTITVADARIANGTIALSDDSITPAFGATLTAVTVAASRLATGKAAPGHVELAFDSDGARFDGAADVDIAALAARGHFALTKFSLARLFPYYASALALDVKRGSLALAGDFDVATEASPPQVKLTNGEATVTDVELALPDEREPLWRIPKGTFGGIGFDLAARRIGIDSFEAPGATLRAVREPDGSINYARLMRTTAATGTAAPATAATTGDATWALVVKKALFDRTTVDIEDRGVAPPVKVHLTDLRALGQNFTNARDAKGSLELRARMGSDGRLALSGPLSTNPPAMNWRVDATGLDLMPLKAYVESQTNIVVTGGRLATRGRLVVAPDARGTTHATYAGDVTVSDFGSLDRPGNQELVRWKTLTLTGVDTGSAPARLAIGAVALDDFYARLIVNPDATLNLQQLMSPPAPASTRAAAKVAEKAPPMSGASDFPVSIGRIAVTAGNVRFSDFFVRPNYTANLTDVAGSVSSLSATQAGDVILDAKVEHAAPVEVRGRINPFAKELTLDLVGKARDVDLPPLTPYAAKYAGYGIEKGKLSLDIHYRIDNRKLTADNKLVLDQLTFGARVDSPTATKLPVLLAVALLKDRNGVIDVDLPIAGSLDDPEFSVGGLVIRVIVNLITRIVTAPFAILGALAGGGEQLAYVEFAPGRATLEPAGEAKLRTLSKALGDRPQLKLDVTGRAIPDVDRDGLKRAQLDRALREQWGKSGGQGAKDDGGIPAAEYPRLLTAVYDDAKLPDKPRNAIGFAKEIPAAEMEALLLASYTVDDEALRALANQRAQVVKSWLGDQGGVAFERMFLVASKLEAGAVKDNGAPTRVDFALK